MYASLGWRNIWRNKKRTIIVASSVFFAVLMAVVMRSGQLGSYSYMIHSSAKLFTGYLQIQGKGYWDNRSLDKSIIVNPDEISDIQTIPHLTTSNPRLEAFSLVSYQNNTKVSQVIGIEPDLENNMTGLKGRMVRGKYLDRESKGVLLAEGLADLLNVTIGDSVVLYGQGYHGLIAAANLPVAGIVKLPFEEMNNGLLFLSLKNAQYIFSAFDRITSLSIMIDNIRNLPRVQKNLNERFNTQFDIKTWDEMMPDLKQNIQVDNASGIIMMAILYIVIGFGVFGTVMMMVSERTREFGILISIGMKKWKLIWVTTIETILVSFVGVLAGFLASIPLIYYLKNNPIKMTGDAARAWESLGIEAIMNFSVDPVVFTSQALVVLAIAVATAAYPVMVIRKMEPIKAIRT